MNVFLIDRMDSEAMTERVSAVSGDVSDLKGRSTLRRFSRHSGARVGAALLGFLVFCAVFAPWIAPHDPHKMSPADALRPPGLQHWFGTDQFGRDTLSRTIYGGRISLMVGIIAVGIGGTLGLVLGGVAGTVSGSRIDELIMRFFDVLLAFPAILLALAVVAILGPGMINLMIAVGISRAPRFARLTRSSVIQIMELDYIQAAHSVGVGGIRIALLYILPNILPAVLVYSTLSVATAILAAAGLSYLGLGAQPPTPEWALMLSTGRDFMRSSWWLTVFPGVAIMCSVISMNLLGDALRDVTDPRLLGRQ